MGLKPHATGDYSIAVIQANSLLEDQGQIFTSPSVTYVGVYDGHGGPEASRFISQHLFRYMHKFATEQGKLSVDVIKKAIDETESEFLNLVKQTWLAQPQIASVGSCCLFGAICNDTLYVLIFNTAPAFIFLAHSLLTRIVLSVWDLLYIVLYLCFDLRFSYLFEIGLIEFECVELFML